MGGRGSSSGISGRNLYKEIPSSQEFKPEKPPRIIKGTAQEIAKATKIRNEIGRDLANYTIKFLSDGRPSTLYQTARQGTEAIEKSIKSSPLVTGTSGRLREEKIRNEINAYKDLASRMKRYNEIITKNNAQYWLSESPWELKRKLYRKIDGK